MSEAEAVAQAQLDLIVKVLEIFRKALRQIDATLPPSPQELSKDDHAEGDPDVTKKARSGRVVQCVLTDRIDAAIRELSRPRRSTSRPSPRQRRSRGNERCRTHEGPERGRHAVGSGACEAKSSKRHRGKDDSTVSIVVTGELGLDLDLVRKSGFRIVRHGVRELDGSFSSSLGMTIPAPKLSILSSGVTWSPTIS